MTLHWSSNFVGVPWREKGRTRWGCDCWGLVRLVYTGALGLALPSYDEGYASVEERGEIDALMSEDASRWPWAMVPAGREAEFDVAVFRRGAMAAHVGVVAELGRMLHVDRERESCVVSYADAPWSNRLIGIYRHAQFR
jgi:cell wall-associated NlpC family hydrolase